MGNFSPLATTPLHHSREKMYHFNRIKSCQHFLYTASVVSIRLLLYAQRGPKGRAENAIVTEARIRVLSFIQIVYIQWGSRAELRMRILRMRAKRASEFYCMYIVYTLHNTGSPEGPSWGCERKRASEFYYIHNAARRLYFPQILHPLPNFFVVSICQNVLCERIV